MRISWTMFMVAVVGCNTSGTNGTHAGRSAKANARSRAGASARPGVAAVPRPDAAASAAASRQSRDAAKAPPDSTVDTLPESAIKTLKGCWRVPGSSETWTFQPQPNHRLRVVRAGAPGVLDVARGARVPSPVYTDPTDHTFGFGTRGRIHGLLMIFKIEGQKLHASVYSSHRPHKYVFTGNNLTLRRCGR